MKFQFNLQTQTLKIVHFDHSLVLSEEHQFRTLGGLGFCLDYPEPPQKPKCWIIFRAYPQKVKAVYKTTSPTGLVTYYQKTVPNPPSEVIELEFTPDDKIKNHA